MLAWRLLVGFALLGLAPVACHRCDPEPEPVPVPASEPTPLPVPPTVAASEPKPLPADLSLISFDKPLGDEQAGIGKPLFPTVVIDGVECDFRDLEPVAREFFAKGQYKEALDAYTLWRPSSWCGTCLSSMHSERYSRIALGHVHLGDYPAAVRTCFEPIGQKELFRGNANEFLVQLYREAGQLDDLKQFLDAVETASGETHPTCWSLTTE